MDQTYQILRTMIERLIIPQYPSVRIHDIDSYKLTNHTEYDVYLLTKTKLPIEDQMRIDSEVKNFFKMAGLDKIGQNKTQKDNILVWFKTPRAKEWSFHGAPDYKHH